MGINCLKGHLRALPTEIISPAKWRSNRKWRPTNGPADRPATKFPKISSFWWVLQWAAGTTGPGNISLRASAPSTENIVRSRFFRLLWSWWMIGRQGRPVPGVWRPMVLRGTWKASTLVPVWQHVGWWRLKRRRANLKSVFVDLDKLCSESFWQNELGHDAPFTILVRVSRYSEVLEWRMKWSQRSSSSSCKLRARTHDRRRPVERCGDLWFIGWGAPSVISCKRRPAE